MNDNSSSRKTMGFSEIKGWLRHRHPMVLLDRIVDYEPKQFMISLLVASGGLDFLAGHFPERAIYPGSHLIQAFAQTGIILFQVSTTPLLENEMTLVGSVEAHFFKVVVPGDRLEIHAKVDRLDEKNIFFSGKALVEGVRVAAFRSSLVRMRIEDLGPQLW